MHAPPNRHPRSEQNLTSSGNLFMLVILIKICLDVSWGVQVSLKDDILGRGTKQSGVFWGLERRKRGLWEQALEEDVGLPAFLFLHLLPAHMKWARLHTSHHDALLPNPVFILPSWYPISQPCLHHPVYCSALPCTLLNAGIKSGCHHAQSGRWVFIFRVGFLFSLIFVSFWGRVST